jgi:hypothetical protein
MISKAQPGTQKPSRCGDPAMENAMATLPAPGIAYEGVHCRLTINRPAAGIALVILAGSDIGEFGDLPMRELAKDLASYGAIELFIDARAVRGASIEVSSKWAFWMATHRSQFKQISMLTGSRYVEITAAFVRRFSGLVDRMRVFTDHAAFDESLLLSIRHAQAA